MQRAVSDHGRSGTPWSIALLDIDHFKRINDRFGHDVGDRVLAELADILRKRLRAGDRLFRMGGEEFVVLLPDTDRTRLEHVLEKLLRAVRRELQCPAWSITVSIGGATLEAGEHRQGWLERADRAMYRAKETRDAWSIAAPVRLRRCA